MRKKYKLQLSSPVEIAFDPEKNKAKLNFSILLEVIECSNISKILFNPVSGGKVTSKAKIAIFINYMDCLISSKVSSLASSIYKTV